MLSGHLSSRTDQSCNTQQQVTQKRSRKPRKKKKNSGGKKLNNPSVSVITLPSCRLRITCLWANGTCPSFTKYRLVYCSAASCYKDAASRSQREMFAANSAKMLLLKDKTQEIVPIAINQLPCLKPNSLASNCVISLEPHLKCFTTGPYRCSL